MGFEIGERVMYQNEEGDAGYEAGKIIAFCNNCVTMINTYLIQLDSGESIRIQLDNSNGYKLDEPVLVPCE